MTDYVRRIRADGCRRLKARVEEFAVTLPPEDFERVRKSLHVAAAELLFAAQELERDPKKLEPSDAE